LITQVINVIGFVLIARKLGPSEYGIYTTIGSFTGFFVVITLTQMAKVLLREGAKNEARFSRLFERTVGLKKALALLSILACLTVTIFMPYDPRTKLLLGIFSFNIIYYAFNDYLLSIYQAFERMQYVAILSILNRTIYVVLGATFLYLGLGLASLVVLTVVTNLASLILNYRLSRRFIKFDIGKRVVLEQSILRSSLVFSLIVFLDFFHSSRIDILMISFMRPFSDVGVYGLACSLVDPLYIFKNILSISFFPGIVKMFHRNKVSARRMLLFSFGFGAFIIVVSFVGALLGIHLIPVLFGEAYIKSIPLFIVLIFSTSFFFMQIPFQNALQATNNEMLILKIVWVPAVMNVVLNLVFINIFGLIGIAYSTLLTNSVLYIIYVLLSWRVLKKQNRII
jgi:O-antigen/teichoic acid export membrane protein